MNQFESTALKNEMLVRAGAGAGKTTRLVNKVLEDAIEFKKINKVWPRLVLTTFTRKATQELRERILKRAMELDSGLVPFASSQRNLMITTIHGLLLQFLSTNGFSIGLDPQFKILKEVERKNLAKKTLKKILKEHVLLQPLLSQHSFSQLIELLLIDFERRLLFEQHRPYSIEEVFLLWTDKCTQLKQQAERWAETLSVASEKDSWKEFSSKLLGWSKEKTPSSIEVAHASLINFLAHLGRKPSVSRKNPELEGETADEFSEFLAELRVFPDSPWHPTEWAEVQSGTVLFEDCAQKFFDAFLARLVEEQSLGFSDLEGVSHFLIRKFPESALNFQKDWEGWYVDEFQDTSPKQVELIQHLRGSSPIFYVGDPQQSIYFFRGARREVFEEQEKAVQKRPENYSVLGTNYRSNPDLLEFFNFCFLNLGKQFRSMEPKEASSSPTEPCAKFVFSGDDDQGLVSLVEELKILVGQGYRWEQVTVLSRRNSDLMKCAHRLEAMGIPTCVHSSQSFYQQREVQDLICLLEFLVNPMNDRNLLELLRSPWLTVPDGTLAEWRGSQVQAKALSLWKFLENKKTELEGALGSVFLRLEGLQRLSDSHGISSALLYAMTDFSVIDFSHFHDGTGKREANLWKFFVRLRQEERRAGFSYTQFILNLRKEVASGSSDEGEAVSALEPNCVNLMTIHASKGLQFDAVFLLGFHKKLIKNHFGRYTYSEEQGAYALTLSSTQSRDSLAFPQKEVLKNLEQKAEQEEFERLLYVAMTRAKKQIFVFGLQGQHARSWSEALKIPLTEGVHSNEKFIYQVRHFLPQMEVDRSFSKSFKEPIELRSRLHFNEARDQVQKSVSVTQLIGENKKQKSGALDLSLLMAQAKGQKIHRFFELLKYQLQQGENSQSLLEHLGEEQGDFFKFFKWLQKLQSPPLLDLINRGHVEWKFAVKMEDAIIQGQIDLWAEDNDKIWILDYKTGSSKNREKAFEQMKVYAKALKIMGHTKEFELVACFPLEEKIFSQKFFL